jgi:hypothetical protein
MKTLLGRKYLLVLPLLFVAGGLVISYGQQKSSATDEGWVDQGIVIHPTITLSSKDGKDLTDKLGKFDKSLYKLEKLDTGKAATTWGTMELCDKLQIEMESSKTKGMSVYQTNFVPTGGPAGAANASVLKKQAKELIKAITPILSKYQPSHQ